MIKRIIIGTILFIVLCIPAKAQDLLASQAPLDEQMKAVDSIALQRLLLNERAEFPAQHLYPLWNNDNIHYTAVLPDSLLIDLRNFCMPTEKTKITDIFGYRPRRRRIHYGLDIKVDKGDTIRAAFSGRVRITSYQRRGYGYYVVIRHDNGLETVYAHLSKQLVKANQFVNVGQPIGLGGNTGRSTGSHLHFETVLMGQSLNPALMFDFVNQDVTGDFYSFYKAKKKGKAGSITTGGGDYYHKVKSGDSLSRIASKYGVSVSALCKLNNITRKSILRPGQLIRYL